ncbi:unnamed protein product [Clonostachys solani]|uniref:N-acetyltransferase domain-containing protein n=1 Tax=Clonostachys solani TaxID=160281 RepID=A0A9P0EIQ7_9HYPO|nr:unnamed protein product [Clonostachys solani]
MAVNGLAQVVADEVDTSTPETVSIIFPDPTTADDENLVSRLTAIVNAVYFDAEKGIFTPEYQRTSDREVKAFIQSRKLAVAYLCPSNEPIGCVFIKKLTPERGEFGMLAVDPAHHGSGFGRLLVSFAEEYCRSEGCTVMQLELLVPTHCTNASKEKMQAWYKRLGYEYVKLGDFNRDYPDLAPLLAGPAEYRVFDKPLA